MDKVHRINSVEWSPSPVVALATSADSSQVAAARADGSLEIWLVSPGSVGWHCQLTIHGDPNSRVSSLVWCQSGPRDGSLGRLLSSSIDGSISEWDLFDLRQKKVLDPIGISLWQIAAEPSKERQEMKCYENGRTSPSITSDVDDEEENNESEDDGDDDDDVYSVQIHEQDDAGSTRIAVACDDGCVRIYSVSDAEKLVYNKTLPRVGGRTLSVAWSSDANRIFSGNSDGLIRCWDVNFAREVYRITIGQGGLHSGNELCIWSLLALRCGTIVSGDSSGGVQFWDGQFGTPLQAHSYHKGDVNALAAAPNHDRVFSAGADGQIIQYKLSSEAVGSGVEKIVRAIKKWIYVGYVRAHTHDVRALTVAVPISHEDLPPDVKVKRARGKKKPLESTSHKWAHSDVPMLISAGDDAKLFAYSVKEFTKFSPHDICPAPQRMPMQLVLKTLFNQTPLLLVQSAHFLDIFSVRLKTSGTGVSSSSSGSLASTDLVARIRCKDSRKIICSTISSSGALFAYSDQLKPNLFELKRKKSGNRSWSLNKRRLPKGLPYAHFMVFSSDSSRLILAGEDRRIYVADVASPKLVHAFTPSRKDNVDGLPPSEPPITKMFTDNDGKWLAAVNCHGDVYIFNLETLRQHWFVSRLDGASVTAGGFTPANSNILVISTSSNQVYALDVEAKKLGEWSMRRTFSLPRRYQELPGEVIGLSFQPSSSSSSVIVYSPRAMCTVDFETPVGKDDNTALLANCKGLTKKVNSNGVLKRKLHDLESNHGGRNNSEFSTFRDPVLFVEHLSKNSLLVIDKPWSQVVNTFEAKPVHRHIFGT